jgi:branched-chain amino acid transport system permease protein
MTLQQILSMLFQGITAASFLALITFAIVLIFKTSYTTNFAQSSIATFSAYVITNLFVNIMMVNNPEGNPVMMLLFSIVIGIIVGFGFGLFIDTMLIRKSRYSNVLTKQMITMGMILVFSGLFPVVFGVYAQPTPMPLTRRVFELNVGGSTPIYISGHSLISIVTTIVVLGAIFIALKYTKWGLGVRATASNEVVAGMMGVNTKFITAMSWGLAGGIGALAAGLFAPTVFTLSPDLMMGLQINGFLAAVLGGFSTFAGPMIAAFIIPISRVFAWQFLSNEWSNAIVYLLVLVIILIKPVGLLGKRIAKKV